MVLLIFRGRDRIAALLPLVAMLTILAGMLLGIVLGRYRMPMAILLALPAGVTVSCWVTWWRARRHWPILLTGAAAVYLSYLSFTWAPPRPH